MACNGCSASNDNNSLDIRFGKLSTHDWLGDVPDPMDGNGIAEIQFKNTRKQFFINADKVDFKRGDLVVVEASPGHDVGRVSLTGKLAELQFKRKVKDTRHQELPKIYRVARENDLEKFESSRRKEYPTLLKSIQLANNLGLEMKISDVEYQGDGRKAIFYYTAEGRVDFRQLIKDYAAEFRVRIEMKQIGARQEAGMIGGIGSCGRELCCSSWRTDFSSISIEAARIQELPASAQKLAGQCGKLKCCLMYELESYLEAKDEFPKQLLEIDVKKGRAVPLKIDVLRKTVFYGYREPDVVGTFTLSVAKVKEVINLNKRGTAPEIDKLDETQSDKVQNEFVSGRASLNQKPRRRSKRNKHRSNREGSRNKNNQ